MTLAHADVPAPPRPLRLWPGVVIVAVQWLTWLVLPVVIPGSGGTALMVAAACGLMAMLWWLLFSRAPWAERVGAIVLMVIAVLATRRLVHASIANGMMGMMLPIYSLPVLSLALVAWAAVTRDLARGPRRAAMAVTILVACGAFTVVRTGGISGDGDADLHWRWTPTPEERLLAQGRDTPVITSSGSPVPTSLESAPPAGPAAPGRTASTTPAIKDPEKPLAREGHTTAAVLSPAARPVPIGADWPGFRGPARDGVARGVRIATDWASSPPALLWRRPIGPGWSSFAAHGHLLYTQEQRGEEEIVSCYEVTTGEPVWRHADAARFWESNGGAGPRGTPALGNGRVYTFGATGILNALSADTGAVVWSRNAASDTGATNPGWGFASSPLVLGDLVIVAASGRLAAYDSATGKPHWQGPTGGAGYSSPHLVTIDGIPQIVLLRGARTTSVAVGDGHLLWEERSAPGVSIVQPAMASDSDLLVAGGDAMGGTGLRRLAIAHGPAGWTTEERWTSRGLKPYFNDFVVHKGHAYGFDGSILAAIDLTDGSRKWKGGRYGSGQLMLLPDQDLLLVLSEDGELALVKATPDQFTELAKVPAIQGKTWNHPALVGDVLLVRNGEEMAAFRVPLASAAPAE
jgi:outer membrane protein assembly factor BamB